MLGPDVNGATVANIDAFKAHGGKLLMYHWLGGLDRQSICDDRLL